MKLARTLLGYLVGIVIGVLLSIVCTAADRNRSERNQRFLFELQRSNANAIEGLKRQRQTRPVLPLPEKSGTVVLR